MTWWMGALLCVLTACAAMAFAPGARGQRMGWHQPAWIYAVGLGLLALWAYGPTFAAGFVYEDAHWLPLMTMTPLSSVRGIVAYTPWLVGTWIGGGEPWGYHAVVFAVHALNALLLGRLIGQVNGWAGWAAAALFLLHPLSSESVAYLTGARETFVATWLLVALTIGTAAWGRAWMKAIAVAALMGAAMLAKPSAVMVLALVPFGLFVLPRGRLTLAWLLPLLAGLAAAIAWPAWRLVAELAREEHIVTIGGPHVWTYAGVTAAAIWRYLTLVVVPVGFSVDRDWRALSPVVPPLALSALGAALLVAIAGVKRWPVYAAMAAWIVIALLPRFVLQQEEILNEHQFLIPSLAVWAACGMWLAPTLERMAPRARF